MTDIAISGRRHFLRLGVGAVTTLAAARMVTFSGAVRAEGIPLDEADPQAKALGYTKDSTKVDAAKYPQHTADAHCAVCQLYKAGPDGSSGACTLFQGKIVVAGGWCAAFVKKPA